MQELHKSRSRPCTGQATQVCWYHGCFALPLRFTGTGIPHLTPPLGAVMQRDHLKNKFLAGSCWIQVFTYQEQGVDEEAPENVTLSAGQ